MCSIKIHSKEFVESLVEKGVCYNKTNILKFPKFLKDELVRHFLRGFFDGDGYVSFRRRKYGYTTRAGLICHAEDFILNVKNHIETKLNFESDLCFYKSRDSYKIDTSNQIQVNKLLEYLYGNSNIYLDRKYNNYLKIKEYLREK